MSDTTNGHQQRTQADWAAALPNLRHKAGELVGPCPACGTGDDRFYVRGDGGAFCRVCCPDGSDPARFKDLLQAAGFEVGKAVTRLPLNGTGTGTGERGREGGRWHLRDEHGDLLYQHVRFDDEHGNKIAVPWFEADGTTPARGVKPRDLPMYGIERAADMPESRPCMVVIVEGEKTCDALRRALAGAEHRPTLVLGTVTSSSTTPSAAALAPVVKAHRTAGARFLRPSEREPIYLWPDHDPDERLVGLKHMQNVGAALLAAGDDVPAAAVRLISWEDAPRNGGDAADWEAAGCSPSIGELCKNAVPVEKPKRSTGRRQRAKPDNPRSLPEIAVIPGTAALWKREAVKAMVAAGPRDDLRSLYASPVTATATGETTGGVTLLRTQPQVDVDSAAKWSADADGRGAGGAVRWPAGELVIEGATDKAIKTILDSHALWVKPHPRRVSDLVPTDPTDGQAADVIEMYRQDCGHAEHPRLRLLRGIVDAPTLRADGTLLASPGYDRQSGLYADFHAEGWKIPHEPTQTDAHRAMEVLHDVVRESPFAAPEHRAVWVAGLLTIVGREYARGNVPLFAVSANNRGAGKGTLVDMATAIATGRPAAKWAPTSGRDAEAEEDKRLTTVALNGTRVLLIDNVKAGDPIGTPALDRAMTAGADGSMGEVSGRLLGKNIEAKAPWRVVVWTTGNNLVTRGDLDRRVLLCRLHTDMERPEERRFKRQSPVDYCITHRRELLTAALVILLAHRRAADAGEAGAVLPPWGSFVYWSARIRSAVAWADPQHADPKRTADEVHEQAHPEQQEAAVFFDAWHAEFGTREVTAREAADSVGYGPQSSDLADAIEAIGVATGKDGRPNVRSLASKLSAYKDRPGSVVLREGRRSSGKPAKWYVEKTAAADVASAEPDPADVDLSEYSRLMLRWEAAVERTPQFEAAAAAVERDLSSAPADAPANVVAPEDRAAMVRWLAFARLQAKVRRDGRPEDEAMNLWLDADRPADVPRPEPGAFGAGATITTTEL